MGHLYQTKVTASGGRHGTIKSDDGILDMKLALPKSLGGPGGATNPEQLFAGGYAACFENALLRVAREAGVKLADPDVEVTCDVGLDRNAANAFVLAVDMEIGIAGIGQEQAEDLVQRADAICPYSNAIRGNVTVAKSVRVR
jgi:Ohr subfamily peroxiredoxin